MVFSRYHSFQRILSCCVLTCISDDFWPFLTMRTWPYLLLAYVMLTTNNRKERESDAGN